MTKEVPRTSVLRDEELIAYLRLQGLDKDIAAADRIEALGKACTEWAEVSQSNYQRAKAAEAKLAKAVEALTNIDALDPENLVVGCSQDALSGLVNRMGDIARDALAEIKGENHE